MNKQILIMTIGFALLTVGLKAQDHDHSKMNQQDHKESFTNHEVSDNFQGQLADVYTSNLSLNEAFVSSQISKVQQAVVRVKEALAKVDMGLLDGDAHLAWMSHLKVMRSSLENISGAENIDDQRMFFAEFSQALYQSVKAFGINRQVAYYQYCPMASSGNGAFWLSDNEEIRNPYFGEGMLTCGSTREIIN